MVIFVCILTMFYGCFCSDFASIIEKFRMIFDSSIFKFSMQKLSKFTINSSQLQNLFISLICHLGFSYY